jgi:hypothetical protein
MKKYLLLFCIALMSSGAFAQVKFGLRLAPNLAISRVQGSGTMANSTSAGPAIRYSFGGVADFFFAPNYAFSSGLLFTTKRAAFQYINSASGADDQLVNGETYKMNLQYIQIPVTFKFFTNEVAPDVRIYFQLGATIDARIAEKRVEGVGRNPDDTDNLTRPVDLGAVVGSGAEWVLGQNTIVFGGLNYNRGLINQLKDRKASDIRLNNDLISLEVGIKF